MRCVIAVEGLVAAEGAMACNDLMDIHSAWVTLSYAKHSYVHGIVDCWIQSPYIV